MDESQKNWAKTVLVIWFKIWLKWNGTTYDSKTFLIFICQYESSVIYWHCRLLLTFFCFVSYSQCNMSEGNTPIGPLIKLPSNQMNRQIEWQIDNHFFHCWFIIGVGMMPLMINGICNYNLIGFCIQGKLKVGRDVVLLIEGIQKYLQT